MLLSSVLLSLLYSNAALAVGPLVKLDYSSYQGTSLPSGVSQWLGIRYAAPPVGKLRFQAPQDPLANSTVQIADKVCLNLRLAAQTTVVAESYHSMVSSAYPPPLHQRTKPHRRIASSWTFTLPLIQRKTLSFQYTSSFKVEGLMPIATLISMALA
jgi:hypothetical protein